MVPFSSLKSYMIVGFILVATIPIVIIGLTSLQTISNGMKKEIEHRNILLSNSLAGETDRFLKESVSLTRQIKNILEKKSLLKNHQIIEYLNLVISNYSFFNRIKILDQQGIVHYIAPFDKNIIGINLSNQDFFNEQKNPNSPYWSNTFISLENGFPTISLSMKYANGIVVADLNLAALNAIVSNIRLGKTSYTQIIDKNGVTIAHINPKLVLERENVMHLDYIKKGLEGQEGTFNFIDHAIDKIASITHVKSTDWIVAVVQSEEEAYRSIKRIEFILLAGTTGAIIFAIIIAIYILRGVLIPLFHLSESSREISEGNYQAQLPEKSYREIDHLSASFKKMMQSLEVRERMLRSSETKFRTLIETITYGVRECDVSGMITFCNSAYDKMFGVKPGSLIGEPIWHDMPGKDQEEFIDHHKFIIENQPYHTPVVTRKITKAGKIIDVKIDWEYKRNEKKELIGFIAIITDITKRKAAERELKRSHEELEQRVAERTKELSIATEASESANKAKTEFLSNISHELRTPMHQILSYSKFGEDKTDIVTIEKLKHYFSQIRNIGARLMSLLNDLLDLSKLEAGQMEYNMDRHDLRRLTENLLMDYKALVTEKSISLRFEDSNIDTEVWCDKQRIQQVIHNLLSNAIKYTPELGEILIFLKSDQLITKNGIGNQKITKGIRISIKDRGIGIPESELDSVFDKFVQSSRTKTGAGGTGLGLAICHEFVVAHGGQIWVENNLDGGTTFSFILPDQKK
ncbi:MAG: PAS domain S-box protein [Deltaproteobacteria bacterium]|nr:PAS domain S-box protein [Deltaproteobacteria bacterium]